MVMKLLLRCVKERVQNLSKTVFLSEIVGSNQLRLSLVILCGKNATTPRSSRALGPSLRNVGEVGESSMAASRLSL